MNDRPLAFRLPASLLVEIDTYAERVAQERGRLRPNRAEALRELVARGLRAKPPPVIVHQAAREQ